MNPYAILNVPYDASAAAIKAAYRKAVKKYHPDVAKNHNNEIIEINRAYELLSDAEWRRKFHSGAAGNTTAETVTAEDPRERAKREYRRRKREEEQAQILWEIKIFHRMFYVNVVIAVFALVLTIDEFLPARVTEEYVVRQWVIRRQMRHSQYTIPYSKTENFTFAVPTGVHFHSDPANPLAVRISFSPIFRVPTQVQTAEASFEPPRTIFSFAIPFHYVLFIGCALILLAIREYNSNTFSFCFLPACVLIVMALFSYMRP